MNQKTPDTARLIAFNKALHFAIYRGARMPVLMQFIEAMWLRIGPILNYDSAVGSSRVHEGTALLHHTQLVKALRAREPEAAREALHGDILSAAEFIISAGVLVSAS